LSTAAIKQRNRIWNASAVITNEYKAFNGLYSRLDVSFIFKAHVAVFDAKFAQCRMRKARMIMNNGTR
jgi:hypothetical protein